MTDDELEMMRRKDADRSPVTDWRAAYAVAVLDRRALLVEVDRLRGTRADEGWLAILRASAQFLSTCSNINETEKLVIEADSHIGWLEGVLCDLQGDDAPRLFHDQGTVEERARIVGLLDERDNSTPHDRAITLRAILRGTDVADLLPPAAVRAELAQERAKVKSLRTAIANLSGPEFSEKKIALALAVLDSTS